MAGIYDESGRAPNQFTGAASGLPRGVNLPGMISQGVSQMNAGRFGTPAPTPSAPPASIARPTSFPSATTPAQAQQTLQANAPATSRTLNGITQPQVPGSSAPRVRPPMAPPAQDTGAPGGTMSTMDFSAVRASLPQADINQLAQGVMGGTGALRTDAPRLDPNAGIGQPTADNYTGTPGQGMSQQGQFRSTIMQQQSALYDRFNQVMDQMANGGNQTTAERMSLGRMANAMATALGQTTQAGTSNFSADVGADNRLGVAGIGANTQIAQTAADNASRQAIADLGAQVEMAGGYQDGNFGILGEAMRSYDRNNQAAAGVMSSMAGNQPSLLEQAQLQLIQNAVNQNDYPTANALSVGANPQVNQYVLGVDGNPILQQQRNQGTGYGSGPLDPYTQEALLQQRLNQQQGR